MQHRLATLFFILGMTSLKFELGQGYPGGAPDYQSECTTLMPGHGPDFQNSKSPYDVIINGASNNGSYDATQNITVRISGTDEATFKGFILQARQYTGPEEYETIGSFVHPSNARFTCQSYTVVGSTVTHTDNNPKTTVEFTWISPINATGNVQFSGTIVESFMIFWRIEPELNMSTPAPVIPTMEFPMNTTGVDISECGRTKGCYLSNCDDPNSVSCEYGVTWSPSTGADGGTAFELFGSVTSSSTPYVALGLSFDVNMGDDSVTDCLYNPNTGSVDVQMSWNSVGSNDAIDQKYLSLVNGSFSGYFVDGMLVCRFTRITYPPSANGTGSWAQQRAENGVYYPGSDVYHLMIAKGIVSGGLKLKHSSNPTVSADKINLTQIAYSSGEAKLNPLKKAHGIIMIFAWMVFASFGILMPRYFKTAWPTKTWLGKAIWFQLHQPLMIVTLILTSTAFILIFVSEGQYSKLDGAAAAHPPMGIIVMSLVLINPIMAVFRPAPDAKRRWIFNIFHFCVGLVAHLSATATLFLAMYITTLNLPEWCVGVMVLYVCWHACVEITLAIHMHYTQRKLKRKNDSKYVVTTSGINLDSDSPTPIYEEVKKTSLVEAYSLFRTAIAGLHLLGVISCATAISVQIAIS